MVLRYSLENDRVRVMEFMGSCITNIDSSELQDLNNSFFLVIENGKVVSMVKLDKISPDKSGYYILRRILYGFIDGYKIHMEHAITVLLNDIKHSVQLPITYKLIDDSYLSKVEELLSLGFEEGCWDVTQIEYGHTCCDFCESKADNCKCNLKIFVWSPECK